VKTRIVLLAGAVFCLPGVAQAQRTAENIVTQSADAFGKAIGSERIGLYSPDDIRGFNPIDAGNVRIEGLYFDHIERVPVRLVEGSTVRVGIAARGYPFPAPTGIVDYGLTLYEGKRQISGQAERGGYGGVAGLIELKLPIIGEKLGVAGGVGFRSSVRSEGGRNTFRNAGMNIAWRPYSGAVVTVMAGGYSNKDDEARATIFPASGQALPQVPREVFLGQPWTDRNAHTMMYGGLVKFPLGHWLIEGGLFDFTVKNRTNFADLLRGVQANGSVLDRVVIYDPGSRTHSLSGEGRVTRQFTSGFVTHNIVLSARGRIKDRLFGGIQRIDLGPSSAIAPDVRAVPVLLPQVKDEDHVTQMTFGLAYGLQWRGALTLDLSASKAQYTKRIDFANPALPVVEAKDNPVLLTAAGSLKLTRRLALYGGVVQGLEEALIAPDIATNRSEAPPAIRTRQVDFGVRYAVAPKVTLVAGLFSVTKPYFNLDPALRYRQLGGVDNKGVEVSLAGQVAPGLTVVAGSLFLNPKISGEAVDAALIGDRPVGSLRRRAIANFDWRLKQGQSPWSVDVALESLSSRVGNAANTFYAPPGETVNLGFRYRFELAQHSALIRVQAQNLLNDYRWQVSSSGGFTFSSSRTYVGQLILDI
jgi:iron complex outermembrane receptor protein